MLPERIARGGRSRALLGRWVGELAKVRATRAGRAATGGVVQGHRPSALASCSPRAGYQRAIERAFVGLANRIGEGGRARR